jgi:hypothetical protein
MSIENLYRKYPVRSEASNRPCAYARDGANFIFGPAAAVGVAVDGVYYSRLPNLAAANTTNFFTANCPEVLLYGALLQAEPYIIGDKRIPVWATMFREAFDAVQDEEKEENRSGSVRSVKVL